MHARRPALVPRPIAGLGIAALIAGSAVIAAGIGSPAAAVDIGPDGLITFSAGDFVNGFDVFTVNPDGTGVTNLTNTPGVSETDPVFSPDGSKIAFVRAPTVGINSDIWMMNSDGTAATALTNDPTIDETPDWAPDGTRLVFMRMTPGQAISDQADLYTIGVDGSGMTNITNSDFDERDPAWSPLGNRIAFAAVRLVDGPFGLEGDWEIVATAPDGSGEANLTNDGNTEDRYPAWSPDGSRIAYSSQPDNPCCGSWDVWVRNADGSNPVDITLDETAAEWFPQFSPDGQRVLYTWVSGITIDLYAVALPGAAPAALALAATPTTPGAVPVTSSGAVRGSADWIGNTPPPPPGPVCTITGTAGNDVLHGTNGDDVICGLAGNDVITGRGGNDTILAGAGNDLVDAGAGNDIVSGGDGIDAVLGGSGDDRLAGEAGSDALTGGTGADTMLGGDGRDVLVGIDLVRGNDTLDGGPERDACFADRGDVVTNC